MSGILFDVQHAIMAALVESADVQDVLGTDPRIYGYVPADAVFPYVAFGDSRIDACDTVFERGFAHVLTLNVYSRYRGAKEAQAIFEALYATLHRKELEIAGQSFVPCSFESADFELMDDGLTTHAAVRFKVRTEE